MAAADTRVVAQVPAFVAMALLSAYFMLVALWVIAGADRGRVFLSAMRYVVLDGRWLKGAWDRFRMWAGWKAKAPEPPAPARRAGAEPPPE